MQDGLEVINDDAILQISGSYRNYVLESKFSMTGVLVDAFPKYGYYYEFDVPSGSMVACQPIEGTPVALFTTTVNGPTTRYSFATPVASGSPQCTFYVFSLLNSPPSVTSGLEVYDENGRLCFSSSNNYMTPAGTWSGKDYNLDIYAAGYPPYYNEKILTRDKPRANNAIVFGGPSGSWGWSSFKLDEWYYESEEDVYCLVILWKNGNLIMSESTFGFRWQKSTSAFNHSYSYVQYYLMLVDVRQFI